VLVIPEEGNTTRVIGSLQLAAGVQTMVAKVVISEIL
jgi:hypothetical protein